MQADRVIASLRPARWRTVLVAGMVAAVLHGAVLVPLLWLAPATPPQLVAAVEITPMPDEATPPPAPVSESTSITVADVAVRPTPTPDSATSVRTTETAAPAPSPSTVPTVQPEIAMAVSAPQPAQSLASAEPPIANAAAELLHADTAPPDALQVQERPLPLPPMPDPQPPPPPGIPRPAHTPAHAVARATPMRRAVTQASESATDTPAPQAAAVVPAPAVAAAAPAPPSSGIPTWRGELIGRLQHAKRYPDGARARGDQGVAMATFTVDRAGHVLSAALMRSSGSSVLDEEAVALIHRAEPLPPVPPEMPGATVTLTVPVTFALR